jgi:hypothetical protein
VVFCLNFSSRVGTRHQRKLLPLAHRFKQTYGSGSRDIQRFSLLRHGDGDAILSGIHQG